MAAWERINGVVYGVIGLHLFVYFATVSCVVRRVRHHLSRISLHLHCTALSKHACAANSISLTLQLADYHMCAGAGALAPVRCLTCSRPAGALSWVSPRGRKGHLYA